LEIQIFFEIDVYIIIALGETEFHHAPSKNFTPHKGG